MRITPRGAAAPTSAGANDTATAAAGTTTAVLPPIDTAALNETVALVADHAAAWAKTSAAQRATLLNRVIADTLAAQDDWLAAACHAKGLTPGST